MDLRKVFGIYKEDNHKVIYVLGVKFKIRKRGMSTNFKNFENQVIEKFGEPDKFHMKNSFLDTEAKYEQYDYEKAMLLFIDEMLYAFSVSHSEWSVLNTYIEGGVRVGDNISKIASLKPEPANWLGEGAYYLCCYEDFNMIINTTSEGVITNINFSFRD